jgi:hypothetical protein
VTAAWAILESVCKTYLEEEGHEPAGKRVLGALWSEVTEHPGLMPKIVADHDLKTILQGLYSISDGVAALRTHAAGHSRRSSSAHILNCESETFAGNLINRTGGQLRR